MRKNIPLAGQIDAEHRSGQDLRHGAFGNDLLFFRHVRRIYQPPSAPQPLRKSGGAPPPRMLATPKPCADDELQRSAVSQADNLQESFRPPKRGPRGDRSPDRLRRDLAELF